MLGCSVANETVFSSTVENTILCTIDAASYPYFKSLNSVYAYIRQAMVTSLGVDCYQASVVDMGGSQVGVGNFPNYGVWSMDH